uniref:Putative lysosomal-associated transmembrane protein 4a n=1 Tax=Tabanus bromius TaxID=304241 RepID=A0A0K8TP39_TABBR
MLRIRVKMGPTRSREWTCCFGLHVHTATIMIGLWHLFLNILTLSLLAVIIRNPDMMHELENSYEDSVDHDAPALPTPLSKIDPPYAYRDHSLNYHNVDMGGLVCICMIAITLMMIYGAVKGKPSHILPFFCLQLFDFAITTLTAAGYLCYLQSVHRLIAESHRLPWREKLLQLSPDALVTVVLIAFVSIVLLKAYAIGIVWRCYKYLTIRQHRSMLPYIIPHVSSTTTRQERDYSTLLPDYEEAIAQSMKQVPPPSYQAAMSNLQAQESNSGNASPAHNNNNTNTNNNNDTSVTPTANPSNAAAAVATPSTTTEPAANQSPPPYGVLTVSSPNETATGPQANGLPPDQTHPRNSSESNA